MRRQCALAFLASASLLSVVRPCRAPVATETADEYLPIQAVYFLEVAMRGGRMVIVLVDQRQRLSGKIATT